MTRVLTVVGARPQFIKAAAVSRAVAQCADVSEDILHTGQHYDDAMSAQFFRELDIPRPAVNLDVGSASHGAQTGRMLEGIEQEILQRQPDWVLVYGDTNSTMAGALAAVKLHVPVAHVEAGLRSFNRSMPEEINRVVTDHVSDVLFVPTQAAKENLAREGITGEKVVEVGDVMYDVALHAGDRAALTSTVLEDLGLAAKGFVLATVHRAENTDDPRVLASIVDGLVQVAHDLPVVLPLHPRTKAALQRAGLASKAERELRLTDPLGYLDMVQLERSAAVVATDSGGVQKEAYFHGTPCVTLRSETEWVELVELGWNRVVPPRDPKTVAASVLGARGTVGATGSPYGSGDAAKRIVEALLQAKTATVA